MAMRSRAALKDLLSITKDGEWGKGEPADGLTEMAVIRGTDFAGVRLGDATSASAEVPPPARSKTLPESRTPHRSSRRFWSTDRTRTATCNWSCAATSGATAPPESVVPTGTSSTTKAASVGSSTSARPTTRRVLWPPNERRLRGINNAKKYCNRTATGLV